jgi:hypothetical protein
MGGGKRRGGELASATQRNAPRKKMGCFLFSARRHHNSAPRGPEDRGAIAQGECARVRAIVGDRRPGRRAREGRERVTLRFFCCSGERGAPGGARGGVGAPSPSTPPALPRPRPSLIGSGARPRPSSVRPRPRTSHARRTEAGKEAGGRTNEGRKSSRGGWRGGRLSLGTAAGGRAESVSVFAGGGGVRTRAERGGGDAGGGGRRRRRVAFVFARIAGEPGTGVPTARAGTRGW